jgi:hypothetical protein
MRFPVLNSCLGLRKKTDSIENKDPVPQTSVGWLDKRLFLLTNFEQASHLKFLNSNIPEVEPPVIKSQVETCYSLNF